jgi:hypothetical protein
MRAALILACLVLLILAALWFFAGRQVALLADRFFPAPGEALPSAPVWSGRAGMQVGDYDGSWIGIDGKLADIRVDAAADGRLVLTTGSRDFPLGTRLDRDDPMPWSSGQPNMPCQPDPGDSVALTRIPGRLAWPTWFESNFVTGKAPDWRRNLYYQLVWRKADGRLLTARWRWEQAHYSETGWSPARLDHLGATGLLTVTLTGPDRR